MKKIQFKIPIYEYNVTYIEVESIEDFSSVNKELKRLGAQKKDIEKVKYNIENSCTNEGEHFYSFKKKHSVIIIYFSTSEKEHKMSKVHEKRHLEDRILELYSIDDIESAGLLSGWLATKF